ncbi:MAG TPA: polysaccharide deacetylase family protein [Vicinamibacterales bacterium]|nr:polysaccharide deacetylase family protein [Vicinamibacterales bacterium]
MTHACLVVMYHYVRDSAATPFPEIRALPPALFEQQLDWLEREHTVISLDELDSAIQGQTVLPANAALLTFDDGFVDHYEVVFPALQRRGIRGVFFLSQQPYDDPPRVLGVHKLHFLLARLGAEALAGEVLRERVPVAAEAGARHGMVFGLDRWERPDERSLKTLVHYELPLEEAERVLDALFVRHCGSEEAFARDLYLGESMIAEMAAAGQSFGYHTRSHRMLSRLSDAEQASELASGVAWIEALTGQSRVAFCYPWGGPKTYNRRTVELLDRFGYSVAFTSERRRADLSRDGRFELPRIDTRDLPPYTDAARAAEYEA